MILLGRVGAQGRRQVDKEEESCLVAVLAIILLELTYLSLVEWVDCIVSWGLGIWMEH